MKHLLTLILLVFLSIPQSWAGWKIIINSDNYGEQQTITYTIDKNRLKISNDQFDFIYDGEDKQITVINKTIKSYYKGSFEDYLSELKHLKEIDSKRVDQIFPKSYFLRFDEMLKDLMSNNQNNSNRNTPNLKVVNTSDQMRLAEYNATEYNIFYDTILVEKLWLSQEVRVSDDIDLLKAISFFRGIETMELKQGKKLNTQAYEQLIYQGFFMKILDYDSYGMEIYKEECMLIQEMEIFIEDSFGIPKAFQERTLIEIIMANS